MREAVSVLYRSTAVSTAASYLSFLAQQLSVFTAGTYKNMHPVFDLLTRKFDLRLRKKVPAATQECLVHFDITDLFYLQTKGSLCLTVRLNNCFNVLNQKSWETPWPEVFLCSWRDFLLPAGASSARIKHVNLSGARIFSLCLRG